MNVEKTEKNLSNIAINKLGLKRKIEYFGENISDTQIKNSLKSENDLNDFYDYIVKERIIITTITPSMSLETKCDWRKFDVTDDLAKAVVNRADFEVSQGNDGHRSKHNSEILEADGSWNSIALNELARAYSHLGTMYNAIESGIDREHFIDIHCKDRT